MKPIIIKIIIIVSFFFNMQIYVFSNEKNNESESEDNKINFKFNFNAKTVSKAGEIDDDTINWNMTRANGYRTLGIFGILISTLVGPGAAVGVYFAIAQPSSSGIFMSVLALLGGIFVSMITLIVFVGGGVIMAVAGFNMYRIYKNSKQPDPFLNFDDDKNALNMGLKIKI